MASLVTSQNRACIKGDHDLGAVNSSRAFLMSLMEEISHDHVEETDEERLKLLIRSLEAEINSNTVDVDNDSVSMEPDHRTISDEEDSQSSSLGQMDDQDCSVSFDDLGLNGLIPMEVVPCSPSHDLNWYMYPCIDGIGNDYSAHNYGGFALGLEYGLWQETTYDSVMYG